MSEAAVKAVNTFDVASYDPNVNVAYGDQATVTEGATYANHLAASGPYILVQKMITKQHLSKTLHTKLVLTTSRKLIT